MYETEKGGAAHRGLLRGRDSTKFPFRGGRLARRHSTVADVGGWIMKEESF